MNCRSRRPKWAESPIRRFTSFEMWDLYEKSKYERYVNVVFLQSGDQFVITQYLSFDRHSPARWIGGTKISAGDALQFVQLIM